MLEVIVLGHIPGTQMQITFAWVLFVVVVSMVWLDVKLHKNRKSAPKKRQTTAKA